MTMVMGCPVPDAMLEALEIKLSIPLDYDQACLCSRSSLFRFF